MRSYFQLLKLLQTVLAVVGRGCNHGQTLNSPSTLLCQKMGFVFFQIYILLISFDFFVFVCRFFVVVLGCFFVFCGLFCMCGVFIFKFFYLLFLFLFYLVCVCVCVCVCARARACVCVCSIRLAATDHLYHWKLFYKDSLML